MDGNSTVPSHSHLNVEVIRSAVVGSVIVGECPALLLGCRLHVFCFIGVGHVNKCVVVIVRVSLTIVSTIEYSPS